MATFATSQTLQEPGHRPADKIATELGVDEAVFINCFVDVSPDAEHKSVGGRQRTQKAILLGCLQAINPAISTDALDAVMDRDRAEGSMRG